MCPFLNRDEQQLCLILDLQVTNKHSPNTVQTDIKYVPIDKGKGIHAMGKEKGVLTIFLLL